LHCLCNRGQIATQQRLRREPQAGEDFAADDPVRARRKPVVLPLAQDEIVDRPILRPPDHVLPHPISTIDIQLLMQVIADAAGRDLGDQLWRAGNIIVFINDRLSPGMLRNH
jgi:hypothetical protein